MNNRKSSLLGLAAAALILAFGALTWPAQGMASAAMTDAAAHGPAPARVEGRRAGEVEFSGAVTALGNGSLTAAGRTVQLTAATEIKGPLAVGVMVKVHASPDAGGVLVAREVDVLGAAASGTPAATVDAFEFTGTVTAVGDGLLVVDGRTVRLAPSTEVKGQLAAGAAVKVHASPDGSGVLVAREVEVLSGAASDDNGRGDDGGKDDSGRDG